MPIYSANLGSGQQYTGADAATGLFDPGQTGAQNIQVRLNSIRFHTTSAVAFSYFAVDPEDPTNKVELFGSTGVDLSDDTGRLLAVAPNGASWVRQCLLCGCSSLAGRLPVAPLRTTHVESLAFGSASTTVTSGFGARMSAVVMWRRSPWRWIP